MTKPLVVSIPHSLGREEAMRRLKTGLSRAASSVPVLSVDEERWEDNRMIFRVRALGQAAAGHVDVAEDHVQVEVVLPWLLQRFAEAAQAAIQNRGKLLLTKKLMPRPAALACRLCRAVEPRFQHGDRQMRQQVGQAQLGGVGIGKAFHRIAADIQRGIISLRTRPVSAAVGEVSEPSRDHDDRGLAAVPPGERDEMIAMLPGHFQRLRNRRP